MTETLAYIRDSLKDIYSPGEAQALLRLVMERVCGLLPHQLLLGKDKDLSDTEKSSIKEIVEGLRKRKPIQYLLGMADFYGMEFKVTPAVLIPRPETAELVGRIIQDYEGLSPSILDIGTGSGCIAIALAKHLPGSQVTAIDISPEALKVADENAHSNKVHVSFIQQDILNPKFSESSYEKKRWDCIVSNPPYIMNREKTKMEANVLENEPHLALFVPDNDPFLFYKAIARIGQKHLVPNGRIYFEINAQKGLEMETMLRQENYKEIELIQDLYGKDRMIKAIV